MQIKNDYENEQTVVHLTPAQSEFNHQEDSDPEDSEGFGSYLQLKMQQYNLSASSKSEIKSQKNLLFNEIMAEVQMDLAEAQKIIAEDRPFLEQTLQKSLTVFSPRTPPSKSKKHSDKLDEKMTHIEEVRSVERVQKTEKKMRKSFIIRKMGSSMAFKEGHENKISAARLTQMPMTTTVYPLASVPARLSLAPSLKTKFLQSVQMEQNTREIIHTDAETTKVFAHNPNIKDISACEVIGGGATSENIIKFKTSNPIQEDSASTNRVVGLIDFQHNQSHDVKEEKGRYESDNQQADDSQIDSSELSFDIKRELEFTQKRLLEIKLQQEIENENAQMRLEVQLLGRFIKEVQLNSATC